MVKNNCVGKKKKKDLEGVIDFLKALSDGTRLQILCLLRKEEKCVCEIIGFLNLPQNLVSHHLKVLRDAGLVEACKSGVQVFYKIKDVDVQKHINHLQKLITKSE